MTKILFYVDFFSAEKKIYIHYSIHDLIDKIWNPHLKLVKVL